jgi:hypothetical protein
MKRLSFLAVLFVAMSMVVSCKKKNNPEPIAPSDRTEVVAARPWKLNQITDTQGAVINRNRLDVVTQAIFGMEFLFQKNNIVRATDAITKQVQNGGTWYLVDEGKSMDIEVSQFKGRFEIISLSNSKLVLRNKVPVSGVSTDANMEFIPSL